jgi:hypothetical protein
MNRSERPSVSGLHRFLFLTALTILMLGGAPAKADPTTHYFTGVVTGVFGISPESDFGVFFDAVTLSGSVTFEGGDADADGSPNYGYFQNVSMELALNVPVINEWLSINDGFCEVWNNQPGVFDEADAISFVGGETGTRTGPGFGNSEFTRLQLTFLDNSPVGSPDMLDSDSLPAALAGWERGFVYLNYTDYSDDGFVPTTVRLEFTPIMAVPEPSAFALVAMGLGAFCWSRRKQA